ncbi:hypothetical protein QOT17_021406 [Balamuthia mandrillaris]
MQHHRSRYVSRNRECCCWGRRLLVASALVVLALLAMAPTETLAQRGVDPLIGGDPYCPWRECEPEEYGEEEVRALRLWRSASRPYTEREFSATSHYSPIAVGKLTGIARSGFYTLKTDTLTDSCDTQMDESAFLLISNRCNREGRPVHPNYEVQTGAKVPYLMATGQGIAGYQVVMIKDSDNVGGPRATKQYMLPARAACVEGELCAYPELENDGGMFHQIGMSSVSSWVCSSETSTSSNVCCQPAGDGINAGTFYLTRDLTMEECMNSPNCDPSRGGDLSTNTIMLLHGCLDGLHRRGSGNWNFSSSIDLTSPNPLSPAVPFGYENYPARSYFSVVGDDNQGAFPNDKFEQFCVGPDSVSIHAERSQAIMGCGSLPCRRSSCGVDGRCQYAWMNGVDPDSCGRGDNDDAKWWDWNTCSCSTVAPPSSCEEVQVKKRQTPTCQPPKEPTADRAGNGRCVCACPRRMFEQCRDRQLQDPEKQGGRFYLDENTCECLFVPVVVDGGSVDHHEQEHHDHHDDDDDDVAPLVGGIVGGFVGLTLLLALLAALIAFFVLRGRTRAQPATTAFDRDTSVAHTNILYEASPNVRENPLYE